MRYVVLLAAFILVHLGDRALKKRCPGAWQALQLVFLLAFTGLIAFFFYGYGTALVRTAESGAPPADKAALTALIALADGAFLQVLGSGRRQWLLDRERRRNRRR